MKKLVSLSGIVMLAMLFACAGQQGSPPATPQSGLSSKSATGEQPAPSQLFTAYNIWIVSSHNMKCINYKHGNNFLPAGTPVQKVKIGEEERPRQEYISFETLGDKKIFQIYYTPSWHPGKTIDDFKKIMFTTKTFQEMTTDLSKREIDAIKAGQIVDGMTAKAVLIAYGCPPEHRTPSLDRKIWVYWSNKFTSFNVCFDDDQKTVICR